MLVIPLRRHKHSVMWVIMLIFITLGLLIATLKTLHKLSAKHGTAVQSASSTTCSSCVGLSAKCEQECIMEAATRPIEYFDDEELDRFKGRDASTYTEEEVEEFAEVLHTMYQTEVKDWCRSLTLRGISLPDQLKDEVFMLMED